MEEQEESNHSGGEEIPAVLLEARSVDTTLLAAVGDGANLGVDDDNIPAPAENIPALGQAYPNCVYREEWLLSHVPPK